MRYRLFFVFALVSYISVFAQEADADMEQMLNDMQRDDYINAYLMITSPGNEAYSVAGHAAIRMVCPSKEVDYCYEYTANVSINQQLDYIIGDMTGSLCRHHTPSYMSHYTELGRSITSLHLNLTPEQKINLWSELDTETDSGEKREFSVMGYNCTSVLRLIVEASLDTDVIQYHNVNIALTGTYRDIFPYVFSDSPWIGLLWNIMNGTDFDKPTEMQNHLFPIALLDEWSKATILSSDRQERSMILETKKLTTIESQYTSPISALTVLILLLVISIISAIIDSQMGYTVFGRVVDVLYMTIESVVGLFITYLLLFSHQVATSWNWLIFVFSPVPMVLWLCLRSNNKVMSHVYALFGIILTIYVLFAPFIPQMRYGHLWILMLAFAIRVYVNWKITKSLNNICINSKNSNYEH